VIFRLSTNDQKTEDYWLFLNREHRGAGLRGDVMLYLERNFANSISTFEKRSKWFTKAIEALGLGQKVFSQQKEKKITFQAEEPWEVEVREEDANPEGNPSWIAIFSFDSGKRWKLPASSTSRPPRTK